MAARECPAGGPAPVSEASAPGRTARTDRLRGRVTTWAPVAGVVGLAGLLRFWKLGSPHQLMFDETYYVKDAYSLMTHGVELNWVKDKDQWFEAGDFSGLQTTGEYVAHPPVGKWLIGAGMWLFGPESSLGWRFSAAVAGTLVVLLTVLIGWRLFNSQALGLLAGLLLAVDGIAVVLSRTGLLDIFLALFVVLALWLILKDRQLMDARLASRMAAPQGHGARGEPLYADRLFGPGLGMRWYLLGAGVALGLATGVKWSGLFFLAVFGVLVVAWDMDARRKAGVRRWLVAGAWRDGPKAFALTVLVALAVYTASWSGWLATKSGYFRDWAATHPGEGATWLPPGLRSLVAYHLEAYDFHTHLTSEHSYGSNPWLWLIQWRPTSFFYESEPTCGMADCSQAVTALGNPLIWWLGLAGLGAVIWGAVVWADRRAWAVVAGYAAGYVPWLVYSERTIFTFYTVAFAPFVVLAVAYGAGRLLGPAWPVPRRREVAIAVVAVAVMLVLVVSAFFFPIWSGQSVPHDFWRLHMWLPTWI